MKLGEDGRWLLGVWAFARWDITSKTVPVNLAGGGQGDYKLGGSQFGGQLRFGFSL